MGAREDLGGTPLHLAAMPPDRPELVLALLEGGADPDARAVGSSTPLHFAARKGDTSGSIVELLDAGANPDLRDNDGMTPLDLAHRNPDLEDSEALWRLMENRRLH